MEPTIQLPSLPLPEQLPQLLCHSSLASAGCAVPQKPFDINDQINKAFEAFTVSLKTELHLILSNLVIEEECEEIPSSS